MTRHHLGHHQGSHLGHPSASSHQLGGLASWRASGQSGEDKKDKKRDDQQPFTTRPSTISSVQNCRTSLSLAAVWVRRSGQYATHAGPCGAFFGSYSAIWWLDGTCGSSPASSCTDKKAQLVCLNGTFVDFQLCLMVCANVCPCVLTF